MWTWLVLAFLPNLGLSPSPTLHTPCWFVGTVFWAQKTGQLKFQTRNEPSGLRVSSVSVIENNGNRVKLKLTGKFTGFLPGTAYLTCQLRSGMNVVGEKSWWFKVQKNQDWTQFIWVNVSGEAKSLSAKIEFDRFVE